MASASAQSKDKGGVHMARIQLEGVTRQYDRIKAIDQLSLDIADNEFFVLFGPAGAG